MSRSGRKGREKRRKPEAPSPPSSGKGQQGVPAGVVWVSLVIVAVVVGGVLFARFGAGEREPGLPRVPVDRTPQSGTTQVSPQVQPLSGALVGASPEVIAAVAAPPPAPPSGPAPAIEPVTGPNAGYIGGTQSCAECHAGIVASYAKVGMGRSISTPASDNTPEDYTTNTIYNHEPSRQFFQMVKEDGKYYQERWQEGPRGERINVLRRSVDFVIGSGNNARSYIHMGAQGEAYQLPVTWYPKPSKWAMSPGYDKADHVGFTRRITYDCAFCHAAMPSLPPGQDFGNYPETSIFPDGFAAIDCERCHGPSAKHVELARGNASLEEIRESVLNPGNFTNELQMDLCMSCHLETTSDKLPHAVNREGRSIYSFRPGEKLEWYQVHLDHPPGVGYDDKFEIAHQAYRLRMSKCFTESEGRMTCTTCHDPHRVPQNRIAAGIASCMTCHTDASCTEAPPIRALQMNNCITCHMPQRRTEDVVNVVMTDHFIQRRKPDRDLLAPLQEDHTQYKGEVALYYPKELPEDLKKLYLGIAQVYNGGNLPGGVAILSDYLSSAPNSFMALMAREVAYKQMGRLGEAVADLRKVISLKPHHPQGWMALGDAYERMQRFADATHCYEQAVALDPKIAIAHSKLGSNKLHQGDIAGAIAACQKAIELDALIDDPHLALASAYGRRGDVAKAAEHACQAMTINPSGGTAWTVLARCLLDLRETGGVRDASWYAAEGLRLTPGRAEAFEVLRDAVDALILSKQLPEIERFAKDIPFEAKVLRARALAQMGSPEAGQILEALADDAKQTSYALVLTAAGEAAAAAGRRDVAVRYHNAAVAVEPTNDDARVSLALALAARDAAGEGEALKVLAAPQGAAAKPQLALAAAFIKATARSANVRDGKAAEAEVRQVMQTIGNNDIYALDTLAAAMAEQGRYQDALVTIRQGLRIAQSEGLPDAFKMLQSRQALYQVNKPLRQGEGPLR